MRTKLKLIIFIICLPLSGIFAQSSASLIGTHDQNKAWLNSVQEAGLEKKIQIIKQRILLDTVASMASSQVQLNPENRPHRADNRIICFATKYPCCVPLMVFHRKRSYTSKDFDGKELKSLSHILSSVTIKKISVFEGPEASAIYGIQGSNGVLVFELKNKRAEKRIKEFVRIAS